MTSTHQSPGRPRREPTPSYRLARLLAVLPQLLMLLVVLPAADGVVGSQSGSTRFSIHVSEVLVFEAHGESSEAGTSLERGGDDRQIAAPSTPSLSVAVSRWVRWLGPPGAVQVTEEEAADERAGTVIRVESL